MSVKLLTEHHLKVLSLKGGCTGTSESTLVKMSHCWKSHVTAHTCADAESFARAGSTLTTLFCVCVCFVVVVFLSTLVKLPHCWK